MKQISSLKLGPDRKNGQSEIKSDCSFLLLRLLTESKREREIFIYKDIQSSLLLTSARLEFVRAVFTFASKLKRGMASQDAFAITASIWWTNLVSSLCLS